MRLRTAIRAGKRANFLEEGQPTPVPAAAIREAINEAGSTTGRSLHILGARVHERLDLDGLDTKTALLLEACELRRGLSGRDARLGSIAIVGSTLEAAMGEAAVDLANASILQDLLLLTCTVNGTVTLTASSIAGRAQLSLGTLLEGRDAEGDSVWADNSNITGGFSISDAGTRLAGAVRMVASQLPGGFRVSDGAQIGRNEAGISLDLDRSRIGHALRISESVCDGALHSIASRIDGLTVTNGARLGKDSNQWSIRLEGTTVEGEVVVSGSDTTLAGALQLAHAKLGRSLRLQNGAFIGQGIDQTSVLGDDARVEGEIVILGPKTMLAGALRFMSASLSGEMRIGRGARVGANASGQSLRADNFSCGALFVRQETTRFAGGIRLNSAQVRGQIGLDAAHIGESATRYSFDADYISTRGGVFITNRVVLAGRVRVAGGSIDGGLNIISGASIGAPRRQVAVFASGLRSNHLQVSGAGTRVEGAIDVGEGTLDRLVIGAGAVISKSSQSVSVAATGLTASDVEVVGSETLVRGGILLGHATVHRNLAVRGASIGANLSGVSIDCDNGRFHGGIEIGGATLLGAVYVENAEVANRLMINESSIGCDPRRISLDADGANFAGGASVCGPGTRLSGGLTMLSLNVRGKLVLDQLSIGKSETGFSVDAEAITCGGLIVRAAQLDGGIDISASRVTVALTIDGETILNSHHSAKALAAVDAEINRLTLFLRSGPGLVDLTECSISSLVDSQSFWTFGDGVRAGEVRRRNIDGLEVGRLSTGTSAPDDFRRRWLRSDPIGRNRAADRGTFRSVAGAQSNAGNDDGAIATLIAMRQEHNPKWLRRLLVPIGQGYRPQWAIGALVLILISTFGLTLWAHSRGQMVATGGLSPAETFDEAPNRDLIDSQDCDDLEYPCLRPAVYALDSMVPGLDLGEVDRWSVRTGRGWAEQPSLMRLAFSGLRLAGWAFGALFLIGALNLVVEQRRIGL